jgi:hypothetical protein
MKKRVQQNLNRKEQVTKEALLENRKEDFVVAPTLKVQRDAQNIHQNLVPNSLYQQFNVSDSRIYGGRFTRKGNLYYCSSQSEIALYNTEDPYNWNLISKI